MVVGMYLIYNAVSISIVHRRKEIGILRALGVTSAKRSELLPDVPAISETLPGFESSVFNGMAAPAGTPREILARVHGEIVKFAQAPDLRARFAQQGVELQASPSPEQFSAYLKSEVARISKLVKELGITPE